MKKLINYILTASLFLTAISCENEEILEQWLEDNPPPVDVPVTGNPGALNLSKFVVLGTSLASGIQDGALYTDGQNLSFPALLAGQFKIQGVGGGDFFQPDINSANGYHVIFNPTGTDLVIGRTYLDLQAQAPAATVGELFGPYTGPAVHNVSAPLLYAGQLVITETGGSGGTSHPFFSPFYARFASSPGTSTPLGQALAMQGTFFVYEASMNDVLLYALTGGDGSAPLTAAGTYQAINNDIIENLAKNPIVGGATYNTPGVVVNVPPVHVFPFFRAIRWNQITLDAATAEALNSGFAGFNAALDAIVANLGHSPADANRRRVSYTAGSNPILAIDEELEDLGPKFDILLGANAITPEQRAALVPYEQSRPLVNGELVLLTAAAGGRLGQNWAGANTTIGVVIPLGLTNTLELEGDQYYLDINEVTTVISAINDYNVALGTIVQTKAAAGAQINYVNIASNIYADAAGADGTLGIVVDGFTLSPDFAPNGIYSTDGVHFNPRGNALIANEIIKVMNSTWGASIPAVDVLKQRSVYFSPSL